MQVILFRAKLSAEAGSDYNQTAVELDATARQMPGFVDVKYYSAEDGEQLAVVWWEDEESLRAWRELPRHREGQLAGRMKWLEYYKIEVATIERVSNFERID